VYISLYINNQLGCNIDIKILKIFNQTRSLKKE